MLKLLFDFAEPSAVEAWRAIDDRVMGGQSRSRLCHDPAGHAVFEGEVSLAGNGGFASVRCSPADRGHAGAAACLIEVRGDPKAFKIGLLTDDGFDGLNYQAGFVPAGSQWHTCACRLRRSAPVSGGGWCPLRRRSIPHASAKSGCCLPLDSPARSHWMSGESASPKFHAFQRLTCVESRHVRGVSGYR
jgi:hypothetical protein